MEFYKTEHGKVVHTLKHCAYRGANVTSVEDVPPSAVIEYGVCETCVTGKDIYTGLARLFNEKTGITDLETDGKQAYINRFEIIKEEVDELEDVVDDIELIGSRPDLEMRAAQELADIVITCFTAADKLDIDLRTAYRKKQGYNLSKSGDNIEGGKVQDDSVLVKPSFRDCIRVD